jgi:Flp pilus assembly protein TadG
MKFFSNNSGATALEFALVAPVFFTLIIGVLQFGYVIWIDNILHYSVDVAARCGAVGSTTPPCQGSGVANMQSTANAVFGAAYTPAPIFIANPSCTGSGLSATGGKVGNVYVSYTVSFLKIVNLRLPADSCYPTYP